MPTKQTGVHKEYVKAAIHVRGGSFRQVARRLGIFESNITNSFKKKISERIDRAIADAAGMKVEDIWPERYGPHAQWKRKR